MAISGVQNNRNRRNFTSIEPIIRESTLEDQTGSQKSDEIEVEVANTKMKVSKEAWRAFQVYQQYEDWSGETEKTDYTYSRLSQFSSKEIIPGFAVRPNLCRSPIKASSPNSLFDYTSERAEEENRRNSLLRRELTTEDGERFSFFQRIVQSLLISWIWVSTLVRRSVRGFFASGAYVFSYFRNVFSRVWSIISGCASRSWGAVSGILPSQGYWGQQSATASYIFIKRRILTVTTHITNVYYTAAETTRRRSYLWLLLPILLLAGYYSYSPASIFLSFAHKTSDFDFTSLFPAFPELDLSLNLDWLPTIDISSLQYCFSHISETVFLTYSWIFEQLLLTFAWLGDELLLVYHAFANITENYESVRLNIFGEELPINGCWVLQNDEHYFREKFSDFCVYFWNIYGLVIKHVLNLWTECAIFWTWFSGALSQLVYINQTKEFSTELSNTEEIYNRIAALEKQLVFEKTRRHEEENRLETTIKQVNQIFLSNRMQQTNRCCRQPCLPTSSSTLSQLQSLVADLQKQSNLGELSTKSVNTALDLNKLEQIAISALKIYDADKTGRADYALETAGGRVVSIRCTRAYSNRAQAGWSFGWLSAPSSNPEDAIRPGMAPGECWAFQGSVGNLVLELSYPVTVTGFTVEHIAKVLSPTGSIDSAPQHFSVWGLHHADDLDDQFLFGEYIYQDNGETLQYFPVLNQNNEVFKFVELKIISNHGHPDYTCLYRIRVHGDFHHF